MREILVSLRFSTVGVMLAGVGSAISGCSAEDAIKALLIWLALALGGGTIEVTTTGGGAAAPTVIVLFSAGRTANGDFRSIGGAPTDPDGRAGADKICQDAMIPAGVDPSTIHAFISVSGTDQLKDLPTLPPTFSAALPVVGPPPAFTPIADDWVDVFDGDDLLATFSAAGVTIVAGGKKIWTGSTAAGSADRLCSGWTTSVGSSSVALSGNFGNADQIITANALSAPGSFLSCNNNTAQLVCAGAATGP